MAAPNTKELAVIKEFRSMITNLELTEDEQTDMALLAWLRARELDLKKSYDMLKASIEWRKVNDIGNIKYWDAPKAFADEFQYRFVGEDIDGNPVGLVPYGVWDIRRALEAGQKDLFIKNTDKIFAIFLDQMRSASKTYNKSITQFVVIIDYKDFSMRQLAYYPYIEALLEVVRRFEANYPETLKSAIVVNAPIVFSVLFNIVKPLLSKRTIGKVEVHGSNDKKWKPALLKFISPDKLPIAYGGTDPFTFKCLNNKGKPSTNSDETEFVSTEIAPGEKFRVELDIKEPTTIKWIFKTDDYDIGFSVILDNVQEVVPYKRCNSHLQSQHGSFHCENLGTYVLIFDNSYSRMKQKTIHYMVTNAPAIDGTED